MSYFTRKNGSSPSWSDRFQGKSSEEMIDEIKKEFDNDKMWFDRQKPTFSSFSKGGFPFEDQMFRRDPSGNVKSHLEDLAKRHPEFAGNLRCPPWGDEASSRMSNASGPSSATDWEHAYTIPVTIEKSDNGPAQQQQTFDTSEAQKPNLSHHGLRNTVDIGEQVHKAAKAENEAQKRSFSAPPGDTVDSAQQQHNVSHQQNDEQPKRFTSKIEITPVNPYETSAPNTRGDGSSEPMESETHHPNGPADPGPMGHKEESNVRHIPIFVEGRSEPVFSKLKGDFTPRSAGNTVPKVQKGPVHTQQPREIPVQRSAPVEPPLKRKFDNPPQAAKPASQQQQQQQQQPRPPPPAKKTPLQQIEEIQKDVDELMKKVEELNGKTRSDKEYMYLDEMLTRNLIKLDIIETEGSEEVRTARKNMIKTIQKCIAVLESKVPANDVTSADVEMTVSEQTDEKTPNEQNNETEAPMEIPVNEVKMEEKVEVPKQTTEEEKVPENVPQSEQNSAPQKEEKMDTSEPPKPEQSGTVENSEQKKEKSPQKKESPEQPKTEKPKKSKKKT